jgi:hypothetical protein
MAGKYGLLELVVVECKVKSLRELIGRRVS